MKFSVTSYTTRGSTSGTGARCRRNAVFGIDTPFSGFIISKRNRYWHVIDPKGLLVCITVYKRGAREVVRRLTA